MAQGLVKKPKADSTKNKRYVHRTRTISPAQKTDHQEREREKKKKKLTKICSPAALGPKPGPRQIAPKKNSLVKQRKMTKVCVPASCLSVWSLFWTTGQLDNRTETKRNRKSRRDTRPKRNRIWRPRRVIWRCWRGGRRIKRIRRSNRIYSILYRVRSAVCIYIELMIPMSTITLQEQSGYLDEQ